MNQAVTNFFKGVGKHSPEILTGVGITAMAGAVVYSAFADEPKLILDEARHDKAEKSGDDVVEFTKWDSAKALAVAYWPAIAMFAVGVGCIIASDCIDDKRNAALTVAYTASETALKTFKEKAVEKIGEEKTKEIQEEADIEISKKTPAPVSDTQIYGIRTDRSSLCYESYGGNYFWSDIESIRRTFNTLNEQLLQEDFISMNEVYSYLGIPQCDMGDDHGFHLGVTGIIDPSYSSKIVEEGPYTGMPCLVISFRVQPRYYYD